MAHEVENMFSVRVTPWHGLGVIINDAPSFEETLKVAGLDWSVSMRKLYLENNVEVSKRAICRDSDNSVLGYATDDYKPLQNNEALNFFKPFHDSGEVSFETAGSLRQGQKVWFLANLKRNPMTIVKGDEVQKFLLLSNAHDGLTGIRVGFTPIRVVCANTLAMAHSNVESKLLRVFHSSKVVANLEAIRDTINTMDASFEATAEQYRKLASKSIHQSDVEKYVTQVFYNNIIAITDREKTIRKNFTNEISELMEIGQGANIPGVKGTVWGLYNATTEYLNYQDGRSQDNRLNKLWFGVNKELNKRALQVAVNMAA